MLLRLNTKTSSNNLMGFSALFRSLLAFLILISGHSQLLKAGVKHTCEKPVPMMEHIIRTSSRKNDVVLDSFAGHGSTAIAAINTDRKYICIEIGKQSFENMANRIKNQGLPVKTKSPKRLTAKPKGQLNLF